MHDETNNTLGIVDQVTMGLQDIPLSRYGKASSIPAPVNRMMTTFAHDFRDEHDINLGVGYVNELTIPRDLIELACRDVLARPQKYRAALNYGGSQGSPNLIESIRKFHAENQIGGLSEKMLNTKTIVIGPNGATSLLEGITHLLPPGIVITTDPMYYIYCNDLERKGFRIIAVPEDEHGIRIDLLQEKLNNLASQKEYIRFLYIVNRYRRLTRSQTCWFALRLSATMGRAVIRR